MSCRLVACLPALMVAGALCAQSAPDRVAWVRTNAVPFTDTSSDAAFAGLARALDGADIVFLGESTHGDGGGHLARVRLVRYLHERLGFNVIAWEAGLRESIAFDSLLSTSAPLGQIMPLALYPWWAQSAELRPVLEYVRSTRRSGRPLTFAGFDIQRSGPLDSLVAYLASAATRSRNPDLVPPALRDSLARGLRQLAALGGQARDSAEDMLEDALHGEAPALRQRIRAARPSLVRAMGVRDADVLARVVENVIAHAAQKRAVRDADPARRATAAVASYNIREARNAANLLWLLRERHRGEKLIVWSHNVHAVKARFTPRFDGISTDPAGARDATARIVADSLGARAYSVTMVAFHGSWGFPGQQPNALPVPAAGTLAAVLHEAGYARAFLDLRAGARSLPAWLQKPLEGTLNAQSAARYPVVWPAATDGVLFIDRMTPGTIVPE